MDGIILIDKIENSTSYDVVKCVKGLYHSNKVGHCGTLDPFATGLLIIGLNQGTKILNYLEHESKEYIATIQLGSSTDTYDKDGQIIASKDIVSFNEKQILEVLEQFKGEIVQTPPIYSSIHIDGKHLYEYARNNEKVEIPTRKVIVFDLKLNSYTENSITIYVKCSRGTYIRSLGYDIAKALNNEGHLSSLRRVSIGNLSVSNADSFASLKEGNVHLLDIKDALPFKQINLKSPLKIRRIYNGQPILLYETDPYVLMMDEDKVIAIYSKSEDNQYICERGLFDESIRYQRIKELSE